MPTKTTKGKQNTKDKATSQSSWGAAIARFNSLMGQFAGMPCDSAYGVFSRAMANMPSINNARIKAISPLPCDYSKEELGEFLRTPQNSELQLQQVAEGLRWSTYSFQKLVKSYADMLEFHSIVLPQHATADEIESDNFKRESRLIDKFIKKASLKAEGRKIAMQAGTQGKVFYVPRYDVDKSHNAVNYFFLQELPKQWCTIIGKNSVSGWTVSFNLMYFMQMGTDFRQFGDLFEPYMTDFTKWQKDKKAFRGKYVYATRNNAREESEVKVWMQDGKWMYYVSLPINRVWTFEIDPSTVIVASPFSGLMQTFAQQADYEAAQLSLILNPLIKIFTGEIPYNNSDNATAEDKYKMSISGRNMFIAMFDDLMRRNNTAGVGFYGAPFENIKSHDFAESANSNQVSQSFLTYGMAKSGMQALIPVTDRPTQGMAEISAKLESQYDQAIYRTFERMLAFILNEELSLRWEWQVIVWGDVYSDDAARAHALKLIDKGDLWGWIVLCSIDGISIFDRVCANRIVKSSGFMKTLEVPQTAYTQSGNSQPKSDTGGAPTKTEQERQQYQEEKQTQGTTEDGNGET